MKVLLEQPTNCCFDNGWKVAEDAGGDAPIWHWLAKFLLRVFLQCGFQWSSAPFADTERILLSLGERRQQSKTKIAWSGRQSLVYRFFRIISVCFSNFQKVVGQAFFRKCSTASWNFSRISIVNFYLDSMFEPKHLGWMYCVATRMVLFFHLKNSLILLENQRS